MNKQFSNEGTGLPRGRRQDRQILLEVTEGDLWAIWDKGRG
jgi:hypothetical protein